MHMHMHMLCMCTCMCRYMFWNALGSDLQSSEELPPLNDLAQLLTAASDTLTAPVWGPLDHKGRGTQRE